MLFSWFLVFVGLVLLFGGGEALVRGASGVALAARLTPGVVGLTIVAGGTAMPELVVSIQSALLGSPDLAIGNVIGSNIFNISAILGLTALARPLRIQGNTVRLEWPVMMLSAFQMYLLGRDGTIDRLEGGFMLLGLVAFIAYTVLLSRKDVTDAELEDYGQLTTASFGRVGSAALAFNIAALIIGAGLLAGGSTALVHGAVAIAGSLGVSKTVIGLTVVAAGTSAPELVTSLVAAWRGRDDIAVANVVGSNIFNVLGIAGTTALVNPLPVPAEVLARDIWWMLGLSALLFPLMKSNMRVNRIEGAVLVGGFSTYMTLLLRAA